MEDVQMQPDDYVLWLKGMFDFIGDRTPTPEEWERFREQNIMQVGAVVMRRIDERQALEEKRRKEAEFEAQEKAKLDAYMKYQAQLQRSVLFGSASSTTMPSKDRYQYQNPVSYAAEEEKPTPPDKLGFLKIAKLK